MPTPRKTIFITGATGYVGSVLTRKAIAHDYQIRGLSRHEKGDVQLKALGAIPIRGELDSFEVLRSEAAHADIVCHLAFVHDYSNFAKSMEIDAAAVDAIASSLVGTSKPFVVSSGTTVSLPDPSGDETDEDSALLQDSLLIRIKSEEHALSWAGKGVDVRVVRLPPYVHGNGGKGFLLTLMRMANEAKEAIVVDGGENRTSAVHVEDAADLYLLVAEKGRKGDVFNATGETNVGLREMAEAIAQVLHVQVKYMNRDEVEKRWDPFLTAFVCHANRASNRKARERLGWVPKGLGLLEDVNIGSYLEVAEKMRAG